MVGRILGNTSYNLAPAQLITGRRVTTAEINVTNDFPSADGTFLFVYENVDWIQLGQSMDQWRALLIAVMKLLGSKFSGSHGSKYEDESLLGYSAV
jgi:hypothetical protein